MMRVSREHRFFRLSGSRQKHRYRRLSQSGFTLLELIAVVALISILMAISVPSWLQFMDTQRLISAQAIVHQGIQQAQNKAQQNRAEWQFSIRDVNGVVEWSVHPQSVAMSLAEWQPIGYKTIQIDSETTLQRSGNGRTVRFNYKGNVVSRLGRVTLTSQRFPQVKRCVYVSTIIGAVREAKEQRRPYNGDFCY